MKRIIAFIMLAMLSMNVAVAQNGASCNTALLEASNNHCVFTNYVITGTEMWFWFKATSKYVNIQAITTQFGADAPHVHGIALYSGTCANLVEIASDELAFFSSADRLAIDLDASGLIVGNIYYIKLTREAKGDVKCDKGDCFPVISPASFMMCIEEVDVFIPIDMQLESPPISHAYYQNRGQLLNTNGTPAMDVKMYTLNANPAVFIGEGFVSFVHSKIDTVPATVDTMHRVDMKLVGMEIIPKVFKTERIPGYVNHFLPHIPNGVTGTKGFSRAVNNDVYPKIDMQYYSNSQGMKFYFVVRPGGDADQIVMKYSGADNVSVTQSNGLKIETPLGNIDFESAHVYRIHPTNNNLVPMPASGDFVDLGNNEFKFDIGNYPSSWVLVIVMDEGGHGLPAPAGNDNIHWSTFYGGSGSEQAWDSYYDENGSLYVTGITYSIDFPITAGTVIPASSGQQDAYAIKLNLQKVRLWATYYGGSASDEAYGITVDADDNVYLTGNTTSFDFPVQNNGTFFQGTKKGNRDAFIVKLNPSGTAKLWATYFGGNDYDFGFAIAYKSPFIYVVGYATTNDPPFIIDFPIKTFAGAYNQTVHGDVNSPGIGDADVFIARFRLDGTQEWTTFLGGEGVELPTGCTVSENGNLLVTGHTRDAGVYTCTPVAGRFPICDPGGTAYTSTNNGLHDAFVSKFNPQGKLLWSTMYGGSREERHTFSERSTNCITTDVTGNIYVTGSTDSSPFPVDSVAGAYMQATQNGAFPDRDIFILKFSAGGELLWATLWGGNYIDIATAIEADPLYNRVYITGYTMSTWLPLMQYPGPPNYYWQPTQSGSWECFFVVLNENDNLEWASYIGGSGSNNEFIKSISVYPLGNDSVSFVLAGHSGSTDYPLQDIPGPNDYFDSTLGGTFDIVMTEFILQQGIVGIKEAGEKEITLFIYPNPYTGSVTLKVAPFQNQDIEIYVHNTLGAVVYNRTLNVANGSHEETIDLSFLASGVYIMQVKAGEKTYGYKLVKQ